jgi:hypothetical protein
LEHGPGLLWLRGVLDPSDPEGAGHALRDLTSTWGEPLPQDARGSTLLAVRDHGFAPGDPRFRGPHSRRALSFHTDRCDLIAFACIRQAAKGGENQVLSSPALAADLAARHPELATHLWDTFAYKRHSIDPANPRRWTDVPLFTEHEGRFAASYLRVLIDRAHADPGLPSLSPQHVEALDLLDRTAREPGRAVRFTLAPGDVLLLNNWVTMHRRTAFEDPPGTPGRLLWRVWLSSPASRALDPRFADHFGATAAGARRGGIHP